MHPGEEWARRTTPCISYISSSQLAVRLVTKRTAISVTLESFKLRYLSVTNVKTFPHMLCRLHGWDTAGGSNRIQVRNILIQQKATNIPQQSCGTHQHHASIPCVCLPHVKRRRQPLYLESIHTNANSRTTFPTKRSRLPESTPTSPRGMTSALPPHPRKNVGAWTPRTAPHCHPPFCHRRGSSKRIRTRR